MTALSLSGRPTPLTPWDGFTANLARVGATEREAAGDKEGGRKFTTEDEEILVLFASLAATAIVQSGGEAAHEQHALAGPVPGGLAAVDDVPLTDPAGRGRRRDRGARFGSWSLRCGFLG